MNIQELLSDEHKVCSCGKIHHAGISHVIVERGATRRLLEMIKSYGAKKYLFSPTVMLMLLPVNKYVGSRLMSDLIILEN